MSCEVSHTAQQDEIEARGGEVREDTYNGQLGPDLSALVGDDGKADDLIFEAHPTDLPEGGEGGGEL